MLVAARCSVVWWIRTSSALYLSSWPIHPAAPSAGAAVLPTGLVVCSSSGLGPRSRATEFEIISSIPMSSLGRRMKSGKRQTRYVSTPSHAIGQSTGTFKYFSSLLELTVSLAVIAGCDGEVGRYSLFSWTLTDPLASSVTKRRIRQLPSISMLREKK